MSDTTDSQVTTSSEDLAPTGGLTTQPSQEETRRWITQVTDHDEVTTVPPNIVARREEDDYIICIFGGVVRRDLTRRDAKLLPELFAAHIKKNYLHIPWDQLNWWVPADEVVPDDAYTGRCVYIDDVLPHTTPHIPMFRQINVDFNLFC